MTMFDYGNELVEVQLKPLHALLSICQHDIAEWVVGKNCNDLADPAAVRGNTHHHLWLSNLVGLVSMYCTILISY